MIEFYRVLLGFTGFYWVFTSSYSFRSSFTGFYWVLLGFYQIFLVSIEFYRVLLGFAKVELVLMGFYWFFLVSIESHRVLLGFTGFCYQIKAYLFGVVEEEAGRGVEDAVASLPRTGVEQALAGQLVQVTGPHHRRRFRPPPRRHSLPHVNFQFDFNFFLKKEKKRDSSEPRPFSCFRSVLGHFLLIFFIYFFLF